MRCEVVPGIHENDHDGVLSSVKVEIAPSQPIARTVFDFRKADWVGLRNRLLEIDSRACLAKSGGGPASDMVQRVFGEVAFAIPSKIIMDKVFAHPWLNNACRRALKRKRRVRHSLF